MHSPSPDQSDWQAMNLHFQAQPQLLDRLIGMLSDTLNGIQQELSQAIASQNFNELDKVAHNLKGTALNLHTPELARLAIQTQEQARQLAGDALETAQTLSQCLSDFLKHLAQRQTDSSTGDCAQ